MTSLSLTLLGENLGAELRGIDVNHMSDSQFEELHRHWLDWGVVRLRHQNLTDAGLQRFSQRFGPLEERPLGQMPQEQRRNIKNRFVTVISNIKVDGKPIGGLGNKEAAWHSDMTYIEQPPPASVLMCIETPSSGGETQFSDQTAAYRALPEALCGKVQTLTIKHNAMHTSVGSLRPGFEPISDPRRTPGAIHPIVRVHEETGVPALYLGRRQLAYIPGLSVEESDQMLDEIWRYAALPEHIWTQRWQVGDLVIWDNRRVMHRREAFDGNARRLMKRCQVREFAII